MYLHRKINKLVRLIALQYAARKCKQNKRYHTSARLTQHRTDGQTDRQTDRRTDRVRRNMRPPPREEGRIISEEMLYFTHFLR